MTHFGRIATSARHVWMPPKLIQAPAYRMKALIYIKSEDSHLYWGGCGTLSWSAKLGGAPGRCQYQGAGKYARL
jgi:hypothetical protein